MTSFDQLLAQAKTRQRATLDVQVLLDPALADRRELLMKTRPLDQRLTAVDPAKEELEQLMAKAADALVTLRFTELPGEQWQEIAARCPARPSAPIDRQHGYNVDIACRLAAPLCGVRVDGDDLLPLRVEKATENSAAVNEWDELFAVISGHEIALIFSAIYELNVYAPAKRIADLGKDLATRTALGTSSTSHSDSE